MVALVVVEKLIDRCEIVEEAKDIKPFVKVSVVVVAFEGNR